MELANVVSVDYLKAQLEERKAAITEAQQKVNVLAQEIEKLKANMVANDGAAQQLNILIEMCDYTKPEPVAPAQPEPCEAFDLSAVEPVPDSTGDSSTEQ
jgi:hypothetical protein